MLVVGTTTTIASVTYRGFPAERSGAGSPRPRVSRRRTASASAAASVTPGAFAPPIVIVGAAAPSGAVSDSKKVSCTGPPA